jgi:hypothetical protein
MTNGRKIDIDRLVYSLNRAPASTRDAVLPVLREEFPEVLWTRHHDGRADAMIIIDGYRP